MNNLLKLSGGKGVNLTFSCLKRQFQSATVKVNPLSRVERLLKKHEEKLLYCGYVEETPNRMGFRRTTIARSKNLEIDKALDMKRRSLEPIPLTLYSHLGLEREKVRKKVAVEAEKACPVNFPYQSNDVSVKEGVGFVKEEELVCEDQNLEVKTRWELYNKSDDHLRWMQDYENYEQIDDDEDVGDVSNVNYGTPDPTTKTSDVPCGGCGALLHCRDTSIPGYIPSEIYKNYDRDGGLPLSAITCQRCHFLKNYDLALQVRVSAEDYPKVLRAISERKSALVVLMVDLLDMPCSIWPGIADLLGRRNPIVVVGNKVDLLPSDGRGYLEKISKQLLATVKESGFGMKNILAVSLISAKTGYGVEDLITKLQSVWQTRGDVFLVGCTNVGKSSLFNALLQSDYCKVQAADLIQRATTSPWPGTTLNLLKFPILRPSGSRLHMRVERLISSKRLQADERKLRLEQFKTTRNPKYATLIGHIDRTFDDASEEKKTPSDVFAVQGKGNSKAKPEIGIDENEKIYRLSKWCFDTPGVVQDDQLIHLLTTEEILLTFPKTILRPQTFSLRPGNTLFIAGLARLDYLEGAATTRFTVFCSSSLPITVCQTTEADRIYEDFVGTEVFAVPSGNPERLRLWRGLQPSKRDFTVSGIDRDYSCADVVLSNAGWIAITPETKEKCTVRGWTPDRKGIYLREALLARSVKYRGQRIRGSCIYRNNRMYMH
ncbi:PREDICTED: nitric oxide-associated protein 1 [Nicrophorus vespilloides]|uniref:Nitric oxide-associated protein 1 n=1 Tax=Nicrophorus vespilloides TaxID=110193 RepID=A0ABM1N520_NICVS|nr:PREDICTED: nitric oxide-associated protein 1 [Nicrophorus vespilloides]